VALFSIAGVAILAAMSHLGAGSRATSAHKHASGRTATAVSAHSTAASRPARSHPPAVTVLPPAPGRTVWTVVARVGGRAAAWLEQRPDVTVMRFDQRFVHLTLHAGSSDGGRTGWRYGDRVTRREIHRLVAGFNGGFKLSHYDVGFVSGVHVAVPLEPGLASVVTYGDGTTNIGSWHDGLPAARKTVFSVLQNQHLLVDRGVPAANLSSCILHCWGATVNDFVAVARSGLGIMPSGRLVWAAGEQLSPASLATALIQAGAVRAIELDINPFWVAGYLYPHQRHGPVAVAVVPGQHGIRGRLLAPNSRDFFTVVAN
jgi:hypothetical protein